MTSIDWSVVVLFFQSPAKGGRSYFIPLSWAGVITQVKVSQAVGWSVAYKMTQHQGSAQIVVMVTTLE